VTPDGRFPGPAVCDAGNGISMVAVYWTGQDWLDYPRLPWQRSRVAFDTEEETEAWLEKQRPHLFA
jgi:hypothetical protein